MWWEWWDSNPHPRRLAALQAVEHIVPDLLSTPRCRIIGPTRPGRAAAAAASYKDLVDPTGLDPASPGTGLASRGRASALRLSYGPEFWWTGRESHPPHAACKAASPLRYMPAQKRAARGRPLIEERDRPWTAYIFGGASGIRTHASSLRTRRSPADPMAPYDGPEGDVRPHDRDAAWVSHGHRRESNPVLHLTGQDWWRHGESHPELHNAIVP